MARKTLLNEQEIRKFLKLANITTVGDKQIEEMYGGGTYNRDEDAEAEIEIDADEEPAPAPEPSLEDEEELLGDEPEDMGAPDDGDMDLGGIDVSEKEELMADVVQAVADALGIADRVDIEAGEGDAMDDLGMGDEPVGMEPEAPLDAPEGGDDSLDMAPADLGGDDEAEDDDPMMETMSEDDIVSEVARRVALRLQDQNNKENMVDNLAERILKRLTNLT